MRDLNNIPALNQAGEDKFIEAKSSIKGESEKKKNIYIEQEIDKKVRQGISEDSAKKMIVSRIENKKVFPNDTFFDNDNIEIKIEEILMNLDKYNKISSICYAGTTLEESRKNCFGEFIKINSD